MLEKLIDKQLGSICSGAEMDPSQYSPLVLAYIGDAVYEMYIRTMLVKKGNMPVHKLHRQATLFVKAKAQSDMIHRIESYLTEEEHTVFKRGRNAKSGTVPKNADLNDYRHATGFEALLGYLYLSKKTKRLIEIIDVAVESQTNQDCEV
ncbi:MAG: Mini-ribonuclease 3 [Clostridia bacterium]